MLIEKYYLHDNGKSMNTWFVDELGRKQKCENVYDKNGSLKHQFVHYNDMDYGVSFYSMGKFTKNDTEIEYTGTIFQTSKNDFDHGIKFIYSWNY